MERNVMGELSMYRQSGHGALLLSGEAPVLGLGGVERRPRQADELALARHAQLRVPAHELPPRGRSLQAPL